jgi:iron complex outermembrane receptor protein
MMPIRLITATLLIACLAAISPPVASAQTGTAGALKRLSLEELGNVRVTSVTKQPETVWQTAAAIYVLTREDIERSGATSIPDVLRLVPGVDVARIDTSRNWVVGIRGFGDQFAKSVLVLIDGRTNYTPLWGGVHWPITDTLLEDVDRIEVVRGPGGTIWGANAQNGVINIITRASGATQGLYASALAGNTDQAGGALRFGGRVGTDLTYRAYAQGMTRGPQYHSDGREFDTWDMAQAGMRTDWQRGRDLLTVTADAYTAVLGESVRVSTFAPPATFLSDDPVDLHGGNVLAKWTRSNVGGGTVVAQGSVDYTYRLGTDFGERRLTADVDMIHQLPRWRRQMFTWGAGARTSPSRMIRTYAFSVFEPNQSTLNLFSAFAQDAVDLIPGRLTVTGGVKLEHNSYTGLETQPSGRVLWTPSDRQSIWGEVTRAVRVPSRVDEDISVTFLLNSQPTYGVIEGNRNLRPETVVGGEVGYRTLVRPSLYVDVVGFRNHYRNLVDFAAPREQTRSTEGLSYRALVLPWINGNEGTTQGLEVAPDWQVTDRMRLKGSYSFVAIDLRASVADSFRRTLPSLNGSTPRHQVALQALMTLPGGIAIDPVYRFVSERVSPAVPAYHAFDARVAVPLNSHLEFSVAGQNLFDARHPEWARDPGPTVEIRRSVYARMTWRR